jgi:8-oxo-dGTP pyrophosphatase MutT (NUDIX family)
MKLQFSAGIITYFKQDHQIEYLLLHYPGGYWDLPKGKMEAGESKEETALRELHEETGLTADILPGFEVSLAYMFKQAGDLISKEVYFFVGQAYSKEIKLSYEHRGYVWLPYEKALKQLTFKNAQDVLIKADEFLKMAKK